MGANPMQKMKRNSTLTGLIIGLIIGLILCVILYLFLTSTAGTSFGGGETVTVCILNKTISSGTKISATDIITKNMSRDLVPANATTQVIDGVAKIDLTAGTIVTTSMLNTSAEALTNDLREQEYNMISLPTNLSVGDFIDIRLQLPNGGDYIVISKKQVLNCNSKSVWLNMYEEEIDLMSNAIIEYYIMTGSRLYATTYTEPGLQTAAVGTYVPNQSVAALIEANPNITTYINSSRYSEELKNLRNSHINSALTPYYVDKDNDGRTEALENIEEKIQEEIEDLKKSRETYFGTLNAAY